MREPRTAASRKSNGCGGIACRFLVFGSFLCRTLFWCPVARPDAPVKTPKSKRAKNSKPKPKYPRSRHGHRSLRPPGHRLEQEVPRIRGQRRTRDRPLLQRRCSDLHRRDFRHERQHVRQDRKVAPGRGAIFPHRESRRTNFSWWISTTARNLPVALPGAWRSCRTS